MNNNYCDPKTGICSTSTLQELSAIGSEKGHNKTEIIYVGDPMCSWCWGISPALLEFRDHFASDGIPFRILVGGLRPGGGEEWNDEMKEFLKHHWEEVNKLSGQAFGYKLFDLDTFNYDTEPSCRAVVAARPIVGSLEMEFFAAIQRKFYVESQDPTKIDFYESICLEFKIDFAAFKERFESEDVKKETRMEFDLSKNWGVSGYPSVLLSINNHLHYIARGYNTFEGMKENMGRVVAKSG